MLAVKRASAHRVALSQSRRLLSTANASNPWFLDVPRSNPPHLPLPVSSPNAPLPSTLLPTHPINPLHILLSASPLLEPGTLLVTRPPPTPAHPLPPIPARGSKRRRGGTQAGQGVTSLFDEGGLWDWLVLAQVKDGTEKRGAIEAVMRLARTTLLRLEPPIPLPPNAFKSRRSAMRTDGWAMLDAGDFALHVLSREARERFFGDRAQW